MNIKHVGRVKATGKKCLVAYRTLPGDAYSCLIIPTESLPDSYHDALINLVESPAGQESYEFAEALARSIFPDGSTMLAALHTQGRLVKTATSNIEMTPSTSVSIQLSELNQIIAEQRGVPVDELAIKPETAKQKAEVTELAEAKDVPAETESLKTTSSSVNGEEQPATTASVEEQAKFYRSQADKLAKEAAAMRRKAEELVPTKKAK